MRQTLRTETVGSATADFLAPSQLRIANISQYGVGLSGVVRIADDTDSGVVTLYLPGTDEPTTVVVSIAWSDRKGRVGLKFIEFRTIASQWRAWFTTGLAETQGGEAEGETALSTNVSAELAAAWRDAAADARTELGLNGRKSHSSSWLWGAFGLTAAVLVIAAAGATLWQWQNRAREAAPPTPVDAPVLKPTVQPAAKQQVRVVTSVSVTEGKLSLATPPEHGAPPSIERSKATRQLEVRYTGSPLILGEQIVDVLLTIDEKGVVSNVTLVRGDPALARDVISTVSHWRYAPFLVDSAPVSVKLPVTAIFRTTRVPATGAQKE